MTGTAVWHAGFLFQTSLRKEHTNIDAKVDAKVYFDTLKQIPKISHEVNKDYDTWAPWMWNGIYIPTSLLGHEILMS